MSSVEQYRVLVRDTETGEVSSVTANLQLPHEDRSGVMAVMRQAFADAIAWEALRLGDGGDKPGRLVSAGIEKIGDERRFAVTVDYPGDRDIIELVQAALADIDSAEAAAAPGI